MPHILDSHSPSDMGFNQSRPARYDHLARLTPHARQHLLHLFVLQTRVVVDVHAHHLGSGREAWSQEATLDSIDLSQSSHSPCHPINYAEKIKVGARVAMPDNSERSNRPARGHAVPQVEQRNEAHCRDEPRRLESRKASDDSGHPLKTQFGASCIQRWVRPRVAKLV